MAVELPDFATLQTLLNQAQLQRDNPALYNILDLLIRRNVQSQNTIVNNTIPAAVSAGIATIPPSTPSILTLTQVDITDTQLKGANATPITIVTGIANKFLIPVFTSIYLVKSNAVAWTNGTANIFLCYSGGNHGVGIGGGGSVALGLNAAATGHQFYNMAHTSNFLQNNSVPAGFTDPGFGDHLQLTTSLALSGSGTLSECRIWCLWYSVAP